MTIADGFNVGLGVMLSIGFVYMALVVGLGISFFVSKLWRR